jgi:hypothetical protein
LRAKELVNRSKIVKFRPELFALPHVDAMLVVTALTGITMHTHRHTHGIGTHAQTRNYMKNTKMF